MNKLNFTLNATAIDEPVIEVSLSFEETLMEALKTSTELVLPILNARKEYYTEAGHKMVRYTFAGMTDNQSEEFETLMKKLAMFLTEIINHSKN